MPFFRLCVLCDASLNGPAGVAGIGVVIKLVNRDNSTDEYPLLFAWNKLRSPPDRSDLAEEQGILFAFVLAATSNRILHKRIRRIAGRPDDLISATLLCDCESAVNRVRTRLRQNRILLELAGQFADQYGPELDIVWEGNHNHAQQHPLALVDGMARQARVHLPVGRTVYARDGNGLDHWLRHRRAEAEAAARAHALEAPW